MTLTLAEVREELTRAHPTARFNPPFIDGIRWVAFCDIPGCQCFVPSGTPCEEFCDPEDAVFGLRCACCGWPEHRHDDEPARAHRDACEPSPVRPPRFVTETTTGDVL